VAVLLCAGAYVFGAAGSNECPAGSVPIETEAACRTASAAAGKTPSSSFVETNTNYPRGCYYYTRDNIAYFNVHAVGAGRSVAQLLCAALATTGAPLPPQTGACSGTPRACVRIWLYMYRSVCVCVCECVRVCVSVCVCVCVYLNIDKSILISPYVYKYICMSVCVCVCMCVCTYIDIYIYIHRYVCAEHAALLRVLVAVAVGRSGQCTAVWGTPENGLCGMALSSTPAYSQGTHRVLTRAVYRMVRCAATPGRGPTSHSVAHVCGTTACTLRWVSGIHSTAERTKGTFTGYVSAAAGSNECPASSVRIETEAACRTAVTAAGKTFTAVGTSSAVPRGCYYFTANNNAWFNTHAVGAGVSGYQLMCSAVTSGATPRFNARARVHRRVPRHWLCAVT
jgi:hypothetical protein